MPIRTLNTLLTQREAMHELGVSERRIAALHESGDLAAIEDFYVAPEGITELIDAINDLLPEGLRAVDKDIAHFKPYRKRVLAQSVVSAATTSGAVTGAVPIPFPDAAILGPIEIAQINALARVYGIPKNEASRKLCLGRLLRRGMGRSKGMG